MTSTYYDLAASYLDNNLHVIPVKDKRPILSDWVNAKEDEVLAFNWEMANGLGLVTGKKSGVICLDIDRIINDQTDDLYDELCSMLPPIYVAKIGDRSKPPARFFRYNGERAKKYQYLDIEILSDGNQTVLPSSMHPKGYVYSYYNVEHTLLNVDIDDLPELDPSVIRWLEKKNDDLKARFKEEANRLGIKNVRQFSLESGRCAHGSHNYLSCLGVAMCYSGESFGYIKNKLIRADQNINHKADYLYFNCPSRKEFKGLSIDAAANKFVTEIFDNHGEAATEQLTGIHTNDAEYEQFCLMFNHLFSGAKKCPLSKEVYVKRFIKYKGNLKAIAGEGVEKLVNIYEYKKSLKSYAVSYGLKPNKVIENFERWVSNMEPEFVLDLPKWDGEDRISQIFKHVEVSSFTSNEVASVFKYWLSNAVRRALDTNVQNETIILKGEQGIGKDNLVNNILRAFNGIYYNSVQIDSMNQKNTYESLEGLIYAYIPEQEELAGARLAFIKDLITGASKKLRKAYAEKAVSIEQTWSFITSSNFDDILKDPSGNRRYIILELEKIDFAYNKYLDSEQIAAQIIDLFTSGFKLDASIRSKINAVRDTYEPEDKVDQACQMIAYKVYKELAITEDLLKGDYKKPYAEYNDIVANAVRCHRGVSLNAVQRRMRHLGFTEKLSNRVYFMVSAIARYCQDSEVTPLPSNSLFSGPYIN